MKIYNRIIELKDLWNDIYGKSKNLTFYQSYEWNSILEKEFFGQRFSKYFGCQLKYFVFDNIIIAPLVIDKRHKRVNILGYKSMSDYLSFICPDDISSVSHDYINDIVNQVGSDYEYVFDKINQNLYFCHYLDRLSDKYDTNKIEKVCAQIDLRNAPESFYETLSKNVRQNYRTAKNRLQKDGHSYSVEVLQTNISQEETKELFSIYRERREDCDGEVSKTRQFVKSCLTLLGIEKYIDIMSEYAKVTPLFYGKIIIDGNDIGAFCEGQYNCDKNIISIGRIATKGIYYKYSPGLIMLVEIIESLKNDINYFDLTRGSEDYKFKLGGIVHNNFCFKIKVK